MWNQQFLQVQRPPIQTGFNPFMVQPLQQGPFQQMQMPLGMGVNRQQFVPKKVIENYSYQLNDQIGSGYSSRVYRGKDDRTEEEVAVKVIDMKGMTNEVQMFLLSNEIQILKRLTQINNQNILKLHDVFLTQNNTYIISEICNQGDLKQLLQTYTSLEEPQALKILKHLINGYRELGKNKIVHRDIKPANILLQNGVPKLADFGFAMDMEAPPFKYYYNVGTPMYMSPQSLQKNEYSVKSDIWAIGVLYYELLYGVTPWTAEEEKELKHKVCNVPVSFPAHKKVSNESKDLITGCLQVEEKKRFSLEQIEKHPLMKLNFKKPPSKSPISTKEIPTKEVLQGIPIQPTVIDKSVPSQQIANQKIQVVSHPSSSMPELGKENSPPHPEDVTATLSNQIKVKVLPASSFQPAIDQKAENETKPGNIIINSTNIPSNNQIPLKTEHSNPKVAEVSPLANNEALNNGIVIPQIQEIPVAQLSQKPIQVTQPAKQPSVASKQTFVPSHYEPVFKENTVTISVKNSEESQFSAMSMFTDQITGNCSTNQTFSTDCSSQQIINQKSELSFHKRTPSPPSLQEFQSNDRVILQQINFCRFLFRLGKQALNNEVIESNYLKEKLIFLISKNIMIKMTKLNALGDNNTLNLLQYKSYIQTESFRRMQFVIAEYQVKFSSFFRENSDKLLPIKSELFSDKKFEAIFDECFSEFESFYVILQSYLRAVIREINQISKNNVSQLDQEVLSHDIEQAVVFLDYLVTYYQLSSLIIEHFNDPKAFADTSRIDDIVEGKPVKLNKLHYANIRQKIFHLEI